MNYNEHFSFCKCGHNILRLNKQACWFPLPRKNQEDHSLDQQMRNIHLYMHLQGLDLLLLQPIKLKTKTKVRIKIICEIKL